jgi:hypothetical protein
MLEHRKSRNSFAQPLHALPASQPHSLAQLIQLRRLLLNTLLGKKKTKALTAVLKNDPTSSFPSSGSIQISELRFFT